MEYEHSGAGSWQHVDYQRQVAKDMCGERDGSRRMRRIRRGQSLAAGMEEYGLQAKGRVAGLHGLGLEGRYGHPNP